MPPSKRYRLSHIRTLRRLVFSSGPIHGTDPTACLRRTQMEGIETSTTHQGGWESKCPRHIRGLGVETSTTHQGDWESKRPRHIRGVGSRNVHDTSGGLGVETSTTHQGGWESKRPRRITPSCTSIHTPRTPTIMYTSMHSTHSHTCRTIWRERGRLPGECDVARL